MSLAIKIREVGDVAVACVQIKGVKFDIMLAASDAKVLHETIAQALLYGFVEIDIADTAKSAYLCGHEDIN